MTGSDMKNIRHGLSEAIGRRLSLTDMAKLCGLKDPGGNGRETYRKWEDSEGPSGPVAVLLSLYLTGVNSEWHDFDGSMREAIFKRLEGEA
jgi:hypothetical protein